MVLSFGALVSIRWYRRLTISTSKLNNEYVETIVECEDCGKAVDASALPARCSICGGLFTIDAGLADRISADQLIEDGSLLSTTSGVWRYQAMLPRLPADAIVSRGEGRTPIYRDERLAAFGGVAQLGLKHEGQNPTGSFKDRGMTVGVSHAKSVGATVVACASTGNTSASLASYAAAGGLKALVLIPEGKISGGKLAQTIAHGALIVQVEGDFDVALSMLRSLTDELPIYLVNSVNPYRIEGQKTIVIEMMEQLGWLAPDVIALPGGNLGNTAAFGKALIELYQTGLIDTVPKLLTVQAEGAAPFADYFDSGFDRYEPIVAETVATAIKIGDPASIGRARKAIQFTNGIVARVSDREILDAKAHIDRCGIGCEPASAATLAGVRKLAGAGMIGPDESVVGVLTGHLLKDTEAVLTYHLGAGIDESGPLANRPISIPSSMDVLRNTVLDALSG